ncbi:MAG TPA: glycosyltransferase [Gammaproteobacteria bacterium]|nr:glycosyltransferase [Gammaproteobacteria bacterium]
MKNIHIVPIPSNNLASSGLFSFVPRLCDELITMGVQVELAMLRQSVPAGMERDFIRSFPYGPGPMRLGNSPQMRTWLRDQAVSGKVQVMHNHSLWMLPNLYPALAARRTSCKLVVSPHGTMSARALRESRWLKKLVRPFLFDPVLRAATAFHATSEQEYKDIRRHGLHQPVAILPNGVEFPQLPSCMIGHKKKLLFLGRIHPIKGVNTLLRAWHRLEERYLDWRLEIAGPDNRGYLREMKQLATELGLERCRFVGPLYSDDKLKAYQEAALYVLPTHSENFGMTVAEALAAGTPAIVTKGAPWQGLERENCGWWIDIGVEPLVTALDEALSLSPERLAQMGRNGREWMKRDFSWEKNARDMVVFYEWLIQGGDKPGFVYY